MGKDKEVAELIIESLRASYNAGYKAGAEQAIEYANEQLAAAGYDSELVVAFDGR